MKKEKIILFRNRPLAAVSAKDLNMERHGTIIDELLAHKLGFVIRDLQYTWITLATNKKTRVCGRIRSTVQLLSKSLPGESLSLNARVVRDLTSITGSELIADENFFKKLSGNREKEERDSPTSDKPVTGASASSTASQNMDATLPNARALQAYEEDCMLEDEYESSDHSSERDCSDCDVYSNCSSEDSDNPHSHRMRCGPHNVAHIGRVRGRKSKLMQEASAKVTEEAVEELRANRDKFKKSPDEDLDEYFPGGSAFAHHLSDRWEKEKQEKAKELQQEQVKVRRLEDLNARNIYPCLNQIQAAMIEKRKKKK